jgi:hypothetical protein
MLGAGWVYGINRMARGGRSVSPDSILGGGFAAGGVVGLGTAMAGLLRPGNATGWIKTLFSILFGNLGSSAAGALAIPVPVNYSASAGVEQWRGLALQALAATGESASWVNAMLSQMSTESSGNPNAINLTDINAQRGYPSMGLLQVIRPTFENTLRGTAFENLIPRGQTDPWANLIAAILYTRNTYGSLAKWNQSFGGNPNPYDNGGWLMPHSTAVNMLREPEPVLTPNQWRIAEEAIDRVSRSGGGFTWNVVQQPDQNPADLAREMNRLLAFEGVYT